MLEELVKTQKVSRYLFMLLISELKKQAEKSCEEVKCDCLKDCQTD